MEVVKENNNLLNCLTRPHPLQALLGLYSLSLACSYSCAIPADGKLFVFKLKEVHKSKQWSPVPDNPNNIINYWVSESATQHSGTITTDGSYRLEIDYTNQGGPGEDAVWLL